MPESWGFAVAHLDEDGDVLDWFAPIGGEHQPLLTFDDAVAQRGDLDADWWTVVEIRPAGGGDDA